MFSKNIQPKNLNSIRRTVKDKALKIMDKMNKLVEYLEIIKEMDTVNQNEIYEREKNILIILYEYYCKYQKAYIDLSFARILSPIDIETVKNIDIKSFIDQIKSLNKQDFDLTISSLKKEDIDPVKNTYEQLTKDVNNLASLLISVQSNIIVQEISPIEQDVILEKIKNSIDASSIINNIKTTEENYSKFFNEHIASKEIFK